MRWSSAMPWRLWENDGDFRAAIEADPEIRGYLLPEQLERTFSLDRQLRHVDAIFLRVFGPVSPDA